MQQMKAQPSPLKCLNYFVTELVFTANSKHNPSNPVTLDFSDLLINTTIEQIKSATSNERDWSVALRIVQNVSDEKKNSPYNFVVALLGTFRVHAKYPTGKVEQLVKINGSSILYSSARQIFWNVMSNGPFSPLMLPTVSFIDSTSENAENKVAEPKIDYGTSEK